MNDEPDTLGELVAENKPSKIDENKVVPKNSVKEAKSKDSSLSKRKENLAHVKLMRMAMTPNILSLTQRS